MSAVSVKGLRKDYNGRPAVDGLDLEIEHGEVFALLGPNGAGKTTTMEILEGYRRRTAGEVSVLGQDPGTAGRLWRARIGIVPQSSGSSLAELTVAEAVEHFAGFYPRRLRTGTVIELVGLADRQSTLIAELSGGQRRRLDLALGLVGDPELLFLDEPTTGFDPGARQQAWQVIRDLRGLGKTVLLTTHYMDEAEHLADRVGVIAAGRLVTTSTPRQLGGRAVAAARVTFRRLPPLDQSQLPPMDNDEVLEQDGLVVVLTDQPGRVTTTLTDWAHIAGCPELPELAITRPSLEDSYLQLLAHASDGATP